MRRLDSRQRIDFLDVSENEDPSCPVDQADLLARFHAREDSQILSGAAAFAAMWRAIPILKPLGLLAKNHTVLRLLEKLYLQFLKVRPKLQKWAAKASTKQ